MRRTSRKSGHRALRQNPRFPGKRWWTDPTNILPGLSTMRLGWDRITFDYYRTYYFMNRIIVRVYPSPDDMLRDDLYLEYEMSTPPAPEGVEAGPMSPADKLELSQYLGMPELPTRVRPGRPLFELLAQIGLKGSGVLD